MTITLVTLMLPRRVLAESFSTPYETSRFNKVKQVRCPEVTGNR